MSLDSPVVQHLQQMERVRILLSKPFRVSLTSGYEVLGAEKSGCGFPLLLH